MKKKINDIRLKQILRETIISWPVVVLISVILLGIEFSLSRPLYETLLDMGVLMGGILAFAMSILLMVLSKVTAKLLVKKDRLSSFFAGIISSGFLYFIFTAQKAVALERQNDPLNMLMTASNDSMAESNIHLVATGMVVLVYSCSVFLNFLYYRDHKADKNMLFQLAMSKLWRLFEYHLLLLRGKFQRTSAKPKIIAERKVYDFIRDKQVEEQGLVSKLSELKGKRDYELAELDNARKRIRTAIKAAYKH